MLYYKITAKEENSAKQIIRTLKNSRSWAVTNGNPLEIYSATGNDHTAHVEGIARDFNATCTVIDKGLIPYALAKAHGGIPKHEYKAFDGTAFTDKLQFAQYERNCNPENQKARKEAREKLVKLQQGNPGEPVRAIKPAKRKYTYRIEPNQPFNLTGVIASLAILEDELLKAYNEVSDVRQKLGKVAEIDKLMKDRDDYLDSARAVLKM